MDIDHLMKWMAQQYEDNQSEAMRSASLILEFSRDYPDMAERMSYPEILEIAERNSTFGIS